MMVEKKAISLDLNKDFNEGLDLAQKLFFAGEVFIYPTDTIYGFGGNPFNPDAVKKIAAIKRRDESKRFILLIDSVESILEYIQITNEGMVDSLFKIWPNPVSVIFRLKEEYAKILDSGTVAFRIPSNKFCQRLLSEIKMPLISTSVNRAGEDPLLDCSEIIEKFSYEVSAILHTDKITTLEPSTIIDFTNGEPVLIRDGKIKFEEILSRIK